MIEKIMKRLKRFTINELELISGVNCSNIIREFLKLGKLKTCGNFYEYVEFKTCDFEIVTSSEVVLKEILIKDAIEMFLKSYAKPNCKTWTVKTYISIFKTNILPYFKNSKLNDLDLDAVLEFYEWLKSKRLSDLRTKNTMALLNQLLHYFQDLGVIDKRCEFKVQRIGSRKTKQRNVI